MTAKKINGKVGRPTVMTEEVFKKLEQAFSIGCNDEEACAHAKISPPSLYDYQNINPDFLIKKNQLKKSPVLKAKNTVFQSLDDVNTAKWYLERKAKDEFGTRQELTGANGKDLIQPHKVLNISPDMSVEQIRALGESIGALGEGYDLDV